MQLFSNNANSTLNGAITNSVGSLTVQTGDGAKFPSPTGGDFFLATLYQKSGATEINIEIVKCTARAGDVLTITRAQEGTTGLAYGNGDPIELRWTAGTATIATAETVTTIGGLINGATDKVTPVDADSFGLSDSAASNVMKRFTWANMKAAVLAYIQSTVGAWNKSQRGVPVVLTDASTIAIDMSLGNNFVVTLGGNRTLGVPTNAAPGLTGIITPRQDATGSRSLALGFIYTTPGGAAPSLTSSVGYARDMWAFDVESFASGTATMTIATPCVVTLAAHGLFNGDKAQLTTTGALPTGLAINTTYWVHVINANTFHLCTTKANAAAGTYIATTGSQSGVHTIVAGDIGVNGSAKDWK